MTVSGSRPRGHFFAHSHLLLSTAGLSKDSVDALRKKVETRQKRLESVRINRKTGWEAEEEKLVSGEKVEPRSEDPPFC